MSGNPHPAMPVFHIDVSASGNPQSPDPSEHPARELAWLLRQMLSAQEKTNHLLEEMVKQQVAQQKQRMHELKEWKDQNPDLAQNCRVAAEALNKVQTDYLHRITEEVNEHADDMIDGEFMLAEFVDRFGPRLAHLNSVLQVLSQLAQTNAPAEAGAQQ